MAQAEIGIIGGSGLYSMPGFTNVHEERVETPFGEPSDAFILGELEGRAVAFLARHAFNAIKEKTNYEEYGGSPLLGVNGICIIAHGSSTPLAVKNALRVAAESIEQQVNPHIVEEIRRYNETTAPLEPALR